MIFKPVPQTVRSWLSTSALLLKNHGNVYIRVRGVFLLSRWPTTIQPVNCEGCGRKTLATFPLHWVTVLCLEKWHLWMTSVLVISCCWQTTPKLVASNNYFFFFFAYYSSIWAGLSWAVLLLVWLVGTHVAGRLAETLGQEGFFHSLCVVLRVSPPRGLSSNWASYMAAQSSQECRSRSGQAFLRHRPGTATVSLLWSGPDQVQEEGTPQGTCGLLGAPV